MFKVTAKNGIGNSPDSNVVSETPSVSTSASVPGQVRRVIAIPSNEQVLLSWTEPSNNGSPITSYIVTSTESGSKSFVTYPSLSDATKATISGLKNDVKYEFRVSAVNSVGEGKESLPVTATPNNRVPLPINNLRAIPGDAKVSLYWTIPAQSIEEINGYRVRVYEGDSDSFLTHSLIGKDTSVVIDGLKNGVSYGFMVVAVSSYGLGPNSVIVKATPNALPFVLDKAPGKITNLKAEAKDSQVILSWSPPNDSGSPITSYRVVQIKSGTNSFLTVQYSGDTSRLVMGGLENGVPYSFKVSAQNSNGFGPESGLVTATPKSSVPQPVIPSWIKNNAKWWAEDKISNLEYVRAIEWLINQGIIKLK